MLWLSLVAYLTSVPAVTDAPQHGFTKHIMRATHFLRDLVARRYFLPRHVPGKSNPADVMTKALSRALFVAVLHLLFSPLRP